MNLQRRIFCLAAALSLFAGAAAAQDKKREAQLRTVRGVVTDKSDGPLSGSVVLAVWTPTPTMNYMRKKTVPNHPTAPSPVSTAVRTSF